MQKEFDTDRIEKLLAILLIQTMKGAPQRDKAVQLSYAGFTNIEIANLLEMTTQSVANCLWEARKGKKKK
jgi:hypothetical protein